MAQHQILRFRIDRRPLPCGSNPRRINLQPPVTLLNIHIPRAADQRAHLCAQSARTASTHPFARSVSARSMYAFIASGVATCVGIHRHNSSNESDLAQSIQMRQRQRLQPHMLSPSNTTGSTANRSRSHRKILRNNRAANQHQFGRSPPKTKTGRNNQPVILSSCKGAACCSPHVHTIVASCVLYTFSASTTKLSAPLRPAPPAST